MSNRRPSNYDLSLRYSSAWTNLSCWVMNGWRKKNTPSEGPFVLPLADLSYPRRKRKPAKGKRTQQDMATKDLTFGLWGLLPPWKEVDLFSESLWESSSYATSPSNFINQKLYKAFEYEFTMHIECQPFWWWESKFKEVRFELRCPRHALLLLCLPTPTMPFNLGCWSVFQRTYQGTNC